MKRSQAKLSILVSPFLILAGLTACSQAVSAHETGTQHVHFQRPRKKSSSQRLTFRSASQTLASPDSQERQATGQRGRSRVANSREPRQAAAENPLREQPPRKQVRSTPENHSITAQSKTAQSRTFKQSSRARPTRHATAYSPAAESADELSNAPNPFPVERIASKLKQSRQVRHDHRVAPASHEQVVYESDSSDACAYCGGEGACEPGCGLIEAGCGIGEPGCGIEEPGCGIVEPGCGIVEPGCGAVDECGSCVGPPKPDYWCFPICLPRLRIIEFSAGVHSFRDARDFPVGTNSTGGTANYGFQEAINVGGRLPLIGQLFPQLSYQLGYQAVQSRLSGTSINSNSRSQNFVTIGMYRRVPVGLQFGVAWDYLQDQLAEDVSQSRADLQQIRYEISLKTPRGREIGFTAATHLNDRELTFVDGVNASTDTYQTVDQYMLFYRWHFHNQGVGRLRAGGTNDSEVILGADFQVPLNDRWSLQSGFNYLIPDQHDVTQEAWNLGMNMIWHWGRTARSCHRSPYMPLFPIADNGWMFVDRVH